MVGNQMAEIRRLRLGDASVDAASETRDSFVFLFLRHALFGHVLFDQ